MDFLHGSAASKTHTHNHHHHHHQVHDFAMRLAFGARASRMVAVTDAMAAHGLPKGVHRLGKMVRIDPFVALLFLALRSRSAALARATPHALHACARTHARTHACARTHARMHARSARSARTHARTHARTQRTQRPHS